MLTRLGEEATPIVRDGDGMTVWPPGVLGSITHCAGYRAAAVARTGDLDVLGIDAKPHAAPPVAYWNGYASTGASPAGDDWREFDRHRMGSATALGLKGVVPQMRASLDFSEADVVIDPATRASVAQMLVPGPVVSGARLYVFTGRFVVADAVLVTAVTGAAGKPLCPS